MKYNALLKLVILSPILVDKNLQAKNSTKLPDGTSISYSEKKTLNDRFKSYFKIKMVESHTKTRNGYTENLWLSELN